MFCQSCLTCIRTILEDLHSTRPSNKSSEIVHESIFEFHQSVVAGCWICRRLWTSLSESEATDISNDDSDSTLVGDPFSMNSRILDKWQNSLVKSSILVRDRYLILLLKICQLPQSKTSCRRSSEFILSPKLRYIKGQQPSYTKKGTSDDDTSTMSRPWMWKHWFHTCSISHEKCRALDQKSKGFLPSRLLQLSTNDGGNSFDWKLVYSAGLDDTSYLTLSHCWGTSQHEILTRDNHDARMKLTSSSQLPKTFQHAFYIAFKLGFHFIWIDSLCIIQKDKDDWLTQSSMMGSIYENASCNIAATWATDGDDGCFRIKETRTILLDLPSEQTWEYQVSDYLLYYDDLMEAPLNSRGWVIQERYLARRQLSFAKSQVYWECRELIASEQYPMGIPEGLRDFTPYNQATPPAGSPTLDFPDTMQRRSAWSGLVDLYSNCKFTKISDKMIALAGLVAKMSLMEEDTYLAGLWKKNIESQLCWITDDDVRRKDDRRRIQSYEAPTWSWASMDGPIKIDRRYYLENVQYKCLMEVLDVSVHSEHESKFHSFTSCSLVLRGVAVWGRPKLSQYRVFLIDDDDWIFQYTDLQNDNSTIDIPVSITWDENISESDINMERREYLLAERDSDLLWMLVNYDDYDDRPWFAGLLLRQQRFPEDQVSYTRMGVFTTRDDKNLFGILLARLGYIRSYPAVSGVDFLSTDPTMFVRTVTIF